MSGIIAVPTIWNIALPASDIMDAAQGKPHWTIRPANIVAGWALDGRGQIVERSFGRSGNFYPMTCTGTLWTPDPPQIKRFISIPRRVRFGTTAGAAPQIVTPDAVTITSSAEAPTPTPGAVAIAPDAVTSTATAGEPTPTPGVVSIVPPAVTTTGEAAEPSAVPGGVSVQPPAAEITGEAAPPVVAGGSSVVEVPAVEAAATAEPPGVVAVISVSVPPVTATGAVTPPAPVPGAVAVAPPAVAITGAAVAPTPIAAAVAIQSGRNPLVPFGLFPPNFLPGWLLPGSGGYQLYRGVNGPASIDYSAPVGFAQHGAGEVVTPASLAHVPGTVYHYGLRAVSDAGVEEEGTDCVARCEVTGAGALVGEIPSSPIGGSVRPGVGGVLDVEILFSGLDSPVAAATLKVAPIPSSGLAGQIDWTADVLKTWVVSSSQRRYRFTTSAYAHGETVRLACRAFSATGAGSPVMRLPEAVADAVGPAAASYLVAAVA